MFLIAHNSYLSNFYSSFSYIFITDTKFFLIFVNLYDSRRLCFPLLMESEDPVCYSLWFNPFDVSIIPVSVLSLQAITSRFSYEVWGSSDLWHENWFSVAFLHSRIFLINFHSLLSIGKIYFLTIAYAAYRQCNIWILPGMIRILICTFPNRLSFVFHLPRSFYLLLLAFTINK